MEVAKGIHRLTRGITNFYLIDDAGKLVVVDAGAPKDWGLFLRALSALNRQLADVDAVLLTHAHSDHTGFAERARTNAEARVWVHEADAAVAKGAKAGKNDGRATQYLLKPQFYQTTFSLLRRGAGKIIPIAEVSTYSDGEMIDVPGHPRVVLAPGHTPGSAALLLEDRRILLSGDVLVTWNALTGRTGPQISPAGLNRDTPQALGSLDNIEQVPADVLLPGHGDPWTGGAAEAARHAREAGPT
jgi:glyoxylase-like metal-dependent hydrolase (beta-lactamase superfamily II)